MIAAGDDPILGQLVELSVEHLKAVIATSGGLLAHATSEHNAAQVLNNVAAALRDQDASRTMRTILADVAVRYGLTLEELRSPSVERYIARARHEAMWLMRQVRRADGQHRYRLAQIGQFLGGRDHSTVLHGVRAHQRRLKAESEAA